MSQRMLRNNNDLMCYCTVCDRSFQYGDATSPIYTGEVWHQLVEYYNFSVHEKYAAEQNLQERDSNLSDRDIHTFICVECAEAALGRPLLLTDVDDCPFNQPFRIELLYRQVQARTKVMDKIFDEIHGDCIPIFYWTDGSRTSYNYDMATDSIISDLGISIRVEKPTDQLTKQYVLDLIIQLESKIINHYWTHYHRNIMRD